MSIDLHVHSKFSDGKMTVEEILREAERRGIKLLSITDHDTIEGQEQAAALAEKYGIQYISGLEMNISFSDEEYNDSGPISLDLLAYQYDINNRPLLQKLQDLRDFRKKRAEKILEKINAEFRLEKIPEFTWEDMKEIEASVDGAFGRPHIADYIVKKRICPTRQKAFERYLVRCNVPKMPMTLQEASELIRLAKGRLILAHPNNPRGTSLNSFTNDIKKQQQIIKESMSGYIDGLECWHSAHDKNTSNSYLAFSRDMDMMVTGGSDCHQDPVIMGSLKVPSFVAQQFGVMIQ